MDLKTTWAKNIFTIDAKINGTIIALNSAQPLKGSPKIFEAGTDNNAANGPLSITPTTKAGMLPNFSYVMPNI